MKVETFKRRFDLESRDSILVGQLMVTKAGTNVNYEYSMCDGFSVATLRQCSIASFKAKLGGLVDSIIELEDFLKGAKEDSSKLCKISDEGMDMETVGLIVRDKGSYIRLELVDNRRKITFFFTDKESRSGSASMDFATFTNKLKQSLIDAYTLAERIHK